MNLQYISTPNDLGGTAVPGCGTIHKSEIPKTLTKLSNDLGLVFDLNDYILGSTGKREYSGDIDLVIDPVLCSNNIAEFRSNLETLFGKDCVAQHGLLLHLKYPIVGYDLSLDKAKPRTGFVQVDFNFGNAEWEKFYHYSDGESGYKGAHRNLMIAAICSVTKFSDLEPGIIDGYNRPVRSSRWKWGPNGLIRVLRVSRKSRDGAWMKKQYDEPLTLPFRNPVDIAGILFPDDGKPEDLNSMETLMDAVKRNYGMVDQERIWRRSAESFLNWNQGKLFKYPSEITAYISLNDK